MVEFICENLPEDWQIRLDFSDGALSIELLHPDTGDEVVLVDDDIITVQAIVQRVNHARTSDGLGPTEECCEHGILEGDWCEKCNRAYKEAAKENGFD